MSKTRKTPRKPAKKAPKTTKKLWLLLLSFFSALALIFFTSKLIIWQIDALKTDAEITELQDSTPVEETPIEDETPEDSELSDEEKMYLSFLYADLSELKQKNPDTVGWIRLAGTKINYPFVQTSNNKFYLSHSFSKNPNSAGWVFLDYRNSPSLTDKNSLLYAHGRTDNTMFGSLRSLLTPSLKTSESRFIKTSTAASSNVYEIFSIYRIPVTSDYLKISFNSASGYSAFLETLKSRSEIDLPAEISASDRILTLSTCFDNSRRLVIHAKLLSSR